jgi:hypothetical protein
MPKGVGMKKANPKSISKNIGGENEDKSCEKCT